MPRVQELQAIHDRHQQVQHHGVRTVFVDAREGFSAVLRGRDAIAGVLERLRQTGPNDELILDDEDALPRFVRPHSRAPSHVD